MVTIKPLFDRVLVKRLENENKTSGGIIIPETAQEKTQTGSVVSFGGGRLLADGTVRPLQVKQGDKIIFGKYSGTEFKHEGAEYLILKEEEILGILE